MRSPKKIRDFELGDIVEVIGRYVDLQPRNNGKYHVGLCPFHDDSTPSLAVYPNDGPNGRWTCFTCSQAPGDAIDFVRKIENCSFAEAVGKCAMRRGLGVAVAEAARKRLGAPEVHYKLDYAHRLRELAKRMPYSEWVALHQRVDTALEDGAHRQAARLLTENERTFA